ncbi:MAG: ribonuclease III family protein [Candidatus Hodarchaeales archaeon]
MPNISEELEKTILFDPKNKSKESLKKFLTIKENAKLGDALVNLIYSIAKTITNKKSTGTKVSDYILNEAYRKSLWFKDKSSSIKGNKGQVGDGVEALILYYWMINDLELDFLVKPLMEKLCQEDFSHPRVERQAAIRAFTKLLDDLFKMELELEKKELKKIIDIDHE